jgi:hypothetical protein
LKSKEDELNGSSTAASGSALLKTIYSSANLSAIKLPKPRFESDGLGEINSSNYFNLKQSDDKT